VSHATVAWIDAAKAGHKVEALDFTGSYWNDIGTPASYAAAVLDTLRKRADRFLLPTAGRQIDGYVIE
jgi:NDP-sugar pyrophosphorylase family protein